MKTTKNANPNDTPDATLKRASNVPRMRTLTKAYEEIKAADPDTAITMRALREMVANGELKVYRVGKKQLVNLDLLFETLYCHYNTDCVVHVTLD